MNAELQWRFTKHILFLPFCIIVVGFCIQQLDEPLVSDEQRTHGISPGLVVPIQHKGKYLNSINHLEMMRKTSRREGG
jgi:hypothetical protein